MAGNLAGDLPSEWWDSLAGEEPEPCDSPRSQVLPDWSWANQQVEECFALPAVGFPDGDAPVDNQCALSDLVSGGLEDVLTTQVFPSVPQESPHRAVFKTAYTERSIEQPVPLPGKEGYTQLSTACTPGASHDSDSKSEVVVDLAMDELSDSVTCNITSNGDSRSSSKECSAAVTAVNATRCKPPGIGGKEEVREHEGDSSYPSLPQEVDLPCKRERLGVECEDDSSVNAGLNFSNAPGKSMGFIPVSNSVLPATSSHSTDGPSTLPARGNDESADDETEGLSSSHLDSIVAALKQRTLDQSGESPTDSRDSGLSEDTTISGPDDAKQRKLGKLTDAASATDVTAPGLLQRKRPGRPAKLTAAASEARTTTKRKRATTSKPAAPAVSGQACTQCFTHVTPVWRAGPEGPKTLCNACGVRYMKVVKRK